MTAILPFREQELQILVVEDDDNTIGVFVKFIQMRITLKVGGGFSV